MENNLKYKSLATVLFVAITSCFSVLTAQENPKKIEREVNEYLREAENAMGENDFASAEASYRKAIAKDPSNTAAKYNLGNLYYNKEKTPEAANRLKQAHEISGSKDEKHRINHNLGNSFMKQKKYQEAIEAYKNALRNNPSDEETRYNLALAKKMLEEEQQNQDQNQDQNEDQEENKDQQENQDDQNKDGEGGDKENQDNQPQDEGENENKDSQDKGDQDKEKQDQKEQQDKGENGEEQEKQPQQQQPAQGQLSPQQIKSLLNAMDNEEKKVQDKINAEKAKGVKVQSEKDW
ncbi:tetratricopeptide repeat protein [Autumnicola psychrophila]|uniref:Tetratricopeptide repeat protein n=1 Tax=Autumnicola psychrophila TaxID=3075592 RepID=A0ABU3DNM9_9FLAO|nr:tetratricopeptide repeat protein [Zunongwangia sp. F225]MDT0685306.1 tetratricopeptide repeat protein [Zunongwangia sp. F225]